MTLPKYNFQIGINLDNHDTQTLRWRALINDIEHFVSGVEIDGVPVRTVSQFLSTGEYKWSIVCESFHYRIDDQKKLFIY